MAIKGSPRDMKKWLELLLDPNIQFPGESGEYRRARNELLESERELRRMNQQVAAERRALPLGGVLQGDYVFESAADGSQVRFSELFAPGKDTLVIYSMMFPRWSQDLRAGAPGGETALLPLVEQPCPSCTSIVDGLEGAAFPSPRGSTSPWSRRQAPIGSAPTHRNEAGTTYDCCPRGTTPSTAIITGETPEGEQLPVLNVFSRDEDGIRHRWASELTFAPGGDTSSLDPIWPIWGALDMTPEGRGDGAGYPSLQYE